MHEGMCIIVRDRVQHVYRRHPSLRRLTEMFPCEIDDKFGQLSCFRFHPVQGLHSAVMDCIHEMHLTQPQRRKQTNSDRFYVLGAFNKNGLGTCQRFPARLTSDFPYGCQSNLYLVNHQEKVAEPVQQDVVLALDNAGLTRRLLFNDMPTPFRDGRQRACARGKVHITTTYLGDPNTYTPFFQRLLDESRRYHANHAVLSFDRGNLARQGNPDYFGLEVKAAYTLPHDTFQPTHPHEALYAALYSHSGARQLPHRTVNQGICTPRSGPAPVLQWTIDRKPK